MNAKVLFNIKRVKKWTYIENITVLRNICKKYAKI